MIARLYVPALLLAVAAGCAMPPPHINSMYTGTGEPVAKPDTATIAVFLDTAPPERPFSVIGRVEIATDNDKRTMEDMLFYAREEARKLGGDALVNLKNSSASTGSAGGYSYPVKNVVTGQVIGTQTVGAQPTNHRVLVADVAVWK